MSLWRGILQRRDDEWTSSLRGLDGIEAKPEIYNENIPAFRHNGAKLGFKKDLRTDEQAQKDFTPFKNKKEPSVLKKLRQDWLGSNFDMNLEDWIAGVLGGTSAREAYEAQDAPFTDIDTGLFDDTEEPYPGYNEDMAEFEGLDEMELMENTEEPGTAMYLMIERRNEKVARYGSMMRITYKDRQMERLSIAFQSAGTLREKQKAYDNFLAAWATEGNSEQSFINEWGMRPEEYVMSGGGATSAPAPVSQAIIAVRSGAERQMPWGAPTPVSQTVIAGRSATDTVTAVEREAYVAWDTYRTPDKNYLLGNSNFKEILKARGIPQKIDGHRASSRNQLIRLLVLNGIKPPT
jgi:hypothetical protein